MKKIFIKIVEFFKKEHTEKYIVEIILFSMLLGLFFALAVNDVVSNVFGAVIGFLFSTMLLYILKVFGNYFEDTFKINYDTESLLKKYKGDKSYRKTLTLNGTSVDFAYAMRLENDGYQFDVIDDKNKFFELDDFIMGNYPAIFSAHSGSSKFNGTTIRLDKFEKCGDKVTFYLSRSTVFNHLVTNRAIDFDIFDGVTLREIYEYGPLLSMPEDSKMSNHIGINGLVFLSDGNILVPRRKRDSTVSKNKVTSSIAVKLDFPKGLDEISTDYLLNGTILDNLSARTKIDQMFIDIDEIKIDFLGFGQNIYEGGKPQFYYSTVLENIDTQKFFEVFDEKLAFSPLDVDKCIYVADYSTFKFKKDYITFDAIDKKGKRRNIKLGYEMSYLCNLWHYERQKEKQGKEKNIEKATV